MAEPWLWGSWGRIGPLTFTDAQRQAAEQDYARLLREGKLNGDPSRPDRPMPMATRQERRAAREKAAAANPPAPPTDIGGRFVTGIINNDPWQTLAKTGAEAIDAVTQPPADAEYPAEKPAVPKTPSATTTAVPPTPPATEVVAPEEEAIVAPTDDFSDAKSYLSLLNEWFPAMPQDNSGQERADKFAEGEMQRTKLLAQLAFAGGLTAAGGGSWKQVGQGFIEAAGVYDKGFERYQAALQDSADRVMKRKQVDYTTDIAKREAALKLYTEGRSDARDRAEKRYDRLMSSLDTRYKAELDSASKGDLGIDEATRQDIMRRWEAAKRAGRYIEPGPDLTKDA